MNLELIAPPAPAPSLAPAPLPAIPEFAPECAEALREAGAPDCSSKPLNRSALLASAFLKVAEAARRLEALQARVVELNEQAFKSSLS